MKLVIIRGPSGSGKSTIAKALGGIACSTWFEADHFFIRDGVYKFDATKLGQAHEWCRNGVRAVLQGCIAANYAEYQAPTTIIVSNTSTTIKELNEYLKIAQEVGPDKLEIIRTPGPWNVDTLLARNAHGVPREVLERQIARYVHHKDEYGWTDMEIFK